MSRWLVDTSVAVPLVLTSHAAHRQVNRKVADRAVELAAHAALETYSVLTRLPGDARLLPTDADVLIRERFGSVVVLSRARSRGLVGELAAVGVAGSALYDALIALTAKEAGAVLLTRDQRAAATYTRLNVAIEIIA